MATIKKSMTGSERMLAACRHQSVDATPVWFMRQAGRSSPDYRKLREKYEMLTLAKTPDLAAKVTLMPVRDLGVDAAVLFADIMLALDGMGVPYHIEPETGPIIPTPIRTQAQIDAMTVLPAEEATPYVIETVKMVRAELKDAAALVGFAGAPFTLACYMIEGRPSRDYAQAKKMMFSHPDMWHSLMEKVTAAVIEYLRGQAKAGIQAAQIFDSWVGMLSPAQYRRYVLPYTTRIFAEVRRLGIPSIHFSADTSSLLELMADAGCDIVSVDWRVMLDDAWARIGYDKGIQGNLDPVLLLAPHDVVEEEARDVLRRAAGRPGHIFNLGHGILPQTHLADMRHLVEFVHDESRR